MAFVPAKVLVEVTAIPFAAFTSAKVPANDKVTSSELITPDKVPVIVAVLVPSYGLFAAAAPEIVSVF